MAELVSQEPAYQKSSSHLKQRKPVCPCIPLTLRKSVCSVGEPIKCAKQQSEVIFFACVSFFILTLSCTFWLIKQKWQSPPICHIDFCNSLVCCLHKWILSVEGHVCLWLLHLVWLPGRARLWVFCLRPMRASSGCSQSADAIIIEAGIYWHRRWCWK